MQDIDDLRIDMIRIRIVSITQNAARLNTERDRGPSASFVAANRVALKHAECMRESRSGKAIAGVLG